MLLDFASMPIFGFDRIVGAVISHSLILEWKNQAFEAGFANLYGYIELSLDS